MLNWRWDKVLGTIRRKGEATPSKRIYLGNCLGVIGQWDKPAPYNDLEKPGWVVYGEFWCDKDHLKRCLESGLYDDVEEVALNSFWWDEAKQIFDAFRKAKIPVKVYYEEPKEKEP